jgi:hypothetical protein
MTLEELNETLADHPGRAKNADLLSLHVPLSISEGCTPRLQPHVRWTVRCTE